MLSLLCSARSAEIRFWSLRFTIAVGLVLFKVIFFLALLRYLLGIIFLFFLGFLSKSKYGLIREESSIRTRFYSRKFYEETEAGLGKGSFYDEKEISL